MSKAGSSGTLTLRCDVVHHHDGRNRRRVVDAVDDVKPIRQGVLHEVDLDLRSALRSRAAGLDDGEDNRGEPGEQQPVPKPSRERTLEIHGILRKRCWMSPPAPIRAGRRCSCTSVGPKNICTRYAAVSAAGLRCGKEAVSFVVELSPRASLIEGRGFWGSSCQFWQDLA